MPAGLCDACNPTTMTEDRMNRCSVQSYPYELCLLIIGFAYPHKFCLL